MLSSGYTHFGDEAQAHRPHRVLFLTGTRADFGKLKPLMLALKQDPAFEVRIFATGMHMLSRYGTTVAEIYKAGITDNVFVYINQDGAHQGMDLALANTITGLGLYVREFPPDLIVVHGDRIEALAGATVGALHNHLVAHIEGGEVSGTVDELIRHAVSKLAHLHFVSNDQAQSRLIQMGERPGSIAVIGSPEVDVMLSDTLPTLEEVAAHYEISFAAPEAYGVLAYHPVTTELERLAAYATEVVDAVLASDWPFVVIYPNNDLGSDLILKQFERLRGNDRFRLMPSMRFEYFLTLIRHARALVGNSSVGVREAPVYGVPSVNIGTRQRNRSTARTITNVPEEREAILVAMASLPPRGELSFQFGRGDSAQRFAEQLRNPALWKTSPQKLFCDLD